MTPTPESRWLPLLEKVPELVESLGTPRLLALFFLVSVCSGCSVPQNEYQWWNASRIELPPVGVPVRTITANGLEQTLILRPDGYYQHVDGDVILDRPHLWRFP